MKFGGTEELLGEVRGRVTPSHPQKTCHCQELIQKFEQLNLIFTDMVKNRTVQRKITRKLIKIETPGSRHLKEKNRGVTTF